MAPGKGLRRFLRWAQLGSIVVAVLVAGWVVHTSHTQRHRREELSHQQDRLKLDAVHQRAYDHFHDIFTQLRFIAMHDEIRAMKPGARDYIEAIFEKSRSNHGVAEIYVLKRDFDGQRRPFIAFEIEEENHEDAVHEDTHSLENEQEEYRAQMEHIRQFAADPELHMLLSQPVELCVAEQGLVLSVPIHNDGELVGIVAAMVVSDVVERLLEVDDRQANVSLFDQDGRLFACPNTPPALRRRIEAHASSYSVAILSGDEAKPIQMGNWHGYKRHIDLFGFNQQMWTLLVLHTDEHHQLAGLLGAWSGGWTIAAMALGLGTAIFILLRVVSKLATAKLEVSRRATALATSQAKLEHQTLHDALTGLPNRARFCQYLDEAIDRAGENPDHAFALLFLDLDRFKLVNDSLGHDVGDQLLVVISEKLDACAHSYRDTTGTARTAVVSRLHGDEFVVLLDDLTNRDEATEVADRIQETMAQPVMLANNEVFNTSSIGVVYHDCGAGTSTDFLRDADTTMYAAKNAGKACHAVFDRNMHDEITRRLHLESDLRRAIERDELTLFYQPIICLETGRLTGFEALLRWLHPREGIIEPDHFIYIAEESGLIGSIGQWVLETACHQLRDWQDRFDTPQPLCMSVNLSKRQLFNSFFVDQVSDVLEQTGLPPACLRLEVTESTIIEEADAISQALDDLKALGVKLHMDDFGTGLSSLSCLHRFPIDALKIDRAFVADLGSGRQYAAIVQAVVVLAHNLNIQVIAEGVENDEQLAQLQALDCSYGQGFLFARPLPADCAEKLIVQLRNGRAGAAA